MNLVIWPTEKSWFETSGAEGGSAPRAEAAEEEEAPSVAAGALGAPADRCCALCGDRFLQFYNEDKEEWHLRNSVRHEDRNYHPLCFEDYKVPVFLSRYQISDSDRSL